MLGIYRVAAQLVASRVVLISTELVSYKVRFKNAQAKLSYSISNFWLLFCNAYCKNAIRTIHFSSCKFQVFRYSSILTEGQRLDRTKTRKWLEVKFFVPYSTAKPLQIQRNVVWD
jgi:hypothetical protein